MGNISLHFMHVTLRFIGVMLFIRKSRNGKRKKINTSHNFYLPEFPMKSQTFERNKILCLANNEVNKCNAVKYEANSLAYC